MSHVGRLLVATPLIGDPTFERTVVLVIAHDAEGAYGIVLNRPSGSRVDEIAPAWSTHASEPAVVFVGGPVGQEAVMGLARRGPGLGAAVCTVTPSLDEIGTVDLNAPPVIGLDAATPWLGLRLFAGGAGWSARQLEDELVEGAWWLVDACEDDVFTDDPAGLWGRVLRRQRGELAWFANCPEDPTDN